MHHECVVGVYSSFEVAKDAVRKLERAAHPPDQVSLVTHSVTREVPEEDTLQYGDKAERNAAKGAGIGGLLGVLLGAPLLAIPGVGLILLAGPLATGITGAIVGSFLGSMSGWGVHADRVREYEERVHEGAILVVANGDPQEVAQAKAILQETDADEVHLHSETSADSPQVHH